MTIAVQSSGGNPVLGAVLTGRWAGDTAQCTTADDGTATIRSARTSNDTAGIAFAVSDVDGLLACAAQLNTAPDDDSDGTSISVSRP